MPFLDMNRRKPKLNLEPETKRSAPPFTVKDVTAPKPIEVTPKPSVILLPATAEELAERRKPQLQTEQVEKKDLPFSVTSEPLPAPRPEVFPTPSMPLRVEEKDYLNRDAPQSDEEKARQIFLTNYCATYGNVSAEEAEGAFREFTATKALERKLAKNLDLRQDLHRKATQWSMPVHVVLIGLLWTIFFIIRNKSTF